MHDTLTGMTFSNVYSMYSYFEVERLPGSLEKNFAVLASQFIGSLNGSSLSVWPVDHVIKHSHSEKTRHLRQLQQLKNKTNYTKTINWHLLCLPSWSISHYPHVFSIQRRRAYTPELLISPVQSVSQNVHRHADRPLETAADHHLPVWAVHARACDLCLTSNLRPEHYPADSIWKHSFASIHRLKTQ